MATQTNLFTGVGPPWSEAKRAPYGAHKWLERLRVPFGFRRKMLQMTRQLAGGMLPSANTAVGLTGCAASVLLSRVEAEIDRTNIAWLSCPRRQPLLHQERGIWIVE